MQTSIISAQSLSKLVSTNQEHLTILKQVNLSIQAGESVAIVGASGAGKSTLMTLLAGLDTPSEGEVYLLGKPLSQLDDEARAALRSESVGFVFQSFLLIPSLSALENVTLPCLLNKAKRRIANVPRSCSKRSVWSIECTIRPHNCQVVSSNA